MATFRERAAFLVNRIFSLNYVYGNHLNMFIRIIN